MHFKKVSQVISFEKGPQSTLGETVLQMRSRERMLEEKGDSRAYLPQGGGGRIREAIRQVPGKLGRRQNGGNRPSMPATRQRIGQHKGRVYSSLKLKIGNLKKILLRT